jgi:hypothetical protein
MVCRWIKWRTSKNGLKSNGTIHKWIGIDLRFELEYGLKNSMITIPCELKVYKINGKKRSEHELLLSINFVSSHHAKDCLDSILELCYISCGPTNIKGYSDIAIKKFVDVISVLNINETTNWYIKNHNDRSFDAALDSSYTYVV